MVYIYKAHEEINVEIDLRYTTKISMDNIGKFEEGDIVKFDNGEFFVITNIIKNGSEVLLKVHSISINYATEL